MPVRNGRTASQSSRLRWAPCSRTTSGPSPPWSPTAISPAEPDTTAVRCWASIMRSGPPALGDPLDVGGSARHDRADVLGPELDGPVPPGRAQEALDVAVVEPLPEHGRRVAADDRVRRHVGGDDRARADDRTVTDAHPGHDHGAVADPHVVADDGVAPA